MTLAALAALTVVGFAVGFLAGLVGIGGGVLIVPFLYFFYGHASWSGVDLAPALHATVAHATSLFIIVPTAIVGTATYARSKLVEWRAAWPVGLFSSVAAFVGAMVATRVPAEFLKVAFGAFLLFMAVQLALRKHGQEEEGPLRINALTAGVTGVLVGIFSALLGVGGGLIAMPLLLHLVRLKLNRLAATSLAIVTIAAASGTLRYMTAGPDATAMPGGHIGYVHVAAAMPMLPGALLAVRWGARLNQRMKPRVLSLTFAVLFAVLGLRLIIGNLATLL